MSVTKTRKTQKRTHEAMVSIPLSAMRCILRYPKEGKIVCEIHTDGIKRSNEAETLDEIINESRLDYAMGNYKSFTNPKDIIAELHA
jgi:hypothetical protein